MVRLFVSEGEGQHALTRKRPGALPAQPELIAAPWRSTLAAAGLTGFLALVGRSRPGTFLRSAAFFGVADLSWTAAELYGRRDINRAVFKKEKLTPEPGKLWERSTHWTTEDVTLAGGVLGMSMALNPRALPGAYGISRFLGAATVGCALGYQTAQSFLVRISPHYINLMDASDKVVRSRFYGRLKEDVEVKASLSIAGKLVLKYHTSQYIQVLRDSLPIAGVGGMGDIPGGQQGMRKAGEDMITPVSLYPDTTKHIPFRTELKEDDFAGPDMSAGYRSYEDSPQSWDKSSVRERLERFQGLKTQAGMELQHLWKELAKREQEHYGHDWNDRDKDISKRELYILYQTTMDLVSRYAIFAYNEADAQKQLQQLQQLDSVPPSPLAVFETEQSLAVAAQDNYQGPRMAATQLRREWTRIKGIVSQYEGIVSQAEAFRQQGSSTTAKNVQLFRDSCEDIRKFKEACERVLTWLEEQVHEAEDKATSDLQNR